SWSWLFYVNIPFGIIAIIVLLEALHKFVSTARDKKIDWWGGLFITATLIPLLLSLVWGGSVYQWASWQIIGSLIMAFVSLFIFIGIEKRVSNPILSLALFRNKVFFTSVCALFFISMGMFGAIIYIPIFSQGVIGGSATHAGLILTPMMLSLVVASTASGQIISRTGKYKFLSIAGTAITVGALFYFSTINENTGNTALIIRMILLGLGLGITMPIFTLAVQSAFPKERLGEVTAGTQLFRSVGGTVGTAVLGGIMNSRLTTHVASKQAEPFVAQMRQLGLGATGSHFDGSFIQLVLNRENQDAIRGMLSKAPPAYQPQLNTNFDHFVNAAKIAFSDAVDGVFLWAALLMVIALVVVFFLPEIPLRRSDRPAIEEAGVVLEDELGHCDGDNQPRIIAARNERMG
ncbi:MAG: MFS transporter, partial [Flavisolibacter sp.]